MMGREEEESCRPKPPVKTRRKKVRVVRGVWMRGILTWRLEMRLMGRRLMRRMGSRLMKARIWCGEV